MEKFIQLAVSHGEAIQEGNSTKANKLNLLLIEIKDGLVSENEMSKLVDLLKNEQGVVRLFASIFLLPFEEELAKETLRGLVKLESITSLDAEIALDIWENDIH